MLDIKKIRENPDIYSKAFKDRNYSVGITAVLENDKNRRQLIAETESLKEQMNRAVDQIGRLKKEKKDTASYIQEMQDVKKSIQQKDTELARIEQENEKILLELPNLPHVSVPVGSNEKDNRIVRKAGEKKIFAFTPKDHVDIGKKTGILDFETASKIAGARFALLRGDGAALERALIQLMLDVHITEHGYTEIIPPFMATPDTMQGTGQLPKFIDELFKCKDDELYLIPTAEVPLTAIHKKEVLAEGLLPIKYVAYTPCFRREAGSYGKDTRGLIRNHQFNKVELVKLVKEEDSLNELESLLSDAEDILKRLNLPYRVVELCTGDLGFASAKTYDLDVWMPGEKRYREVSSCSLFTDFQARRLQIRYKTKEKKNVFVHTLNASGLAVGRIFAAVLENGQQENGSVVIPDVLQKYMHKKTIPPV